MQFAQKPLEFSVIQNYPPHGLNLSEIEQLLCKGSWIWEKQIQPKYILYIVCGMHESPMEVVSYNH